MRILMYAVLVMTIAALLVACEQPPGEISGQVMRSTGRPASVKIQVVDAKSKIVWEGSSDYLSGSWYTGDVIKPGTYTVRYLTGTGEHYEGKDQEITVRPGATEVLNQSI